MKKKQFTLTCKKSDFKTILNCDFDETECNDWLNYKILPELHDNLKKLAIEYSVDALANVINLLDNIEISFIESNSKSVPFENIEECIAESKEHQPFGLLKDNANQYTTVMKYVNGGVMLASNTYMPSFIDLEGAFAKYKFADGTSFGKMES